MKTGFATLPIGARLHYEEKGDGEPLVLIHGLLGTARAELGALIDWLAKRFHVYGLTLRGYGESTPKPRRFPHDFYDRDTEDVIAFMDSMGLASAHYLGFSDGGEIGLIAGGKYPERFRSIVVWGAVGYLGPIVGEEVLKYYPATWVTDEVKARHDIEDANPMIKEWVEAISAMVAEGGDISLHLADRITAPLLLLLGEKDYLNPPEYARQLVDKSRNGRLVMFACGHAIHDEEPESFKKVVGEFLDEVSGGTRYPDRWAIE